MSKALVVNNTTYQYPSPGEDPGWGEGATGWAEEVTNVLNSLLGPGDILETSFNVPSGTSSGDVAGLLFNSSSIQHAKIDYYVYRRSDSYPSGITESGTIEIVYDNDAGAGSKWLFSQEGIGDAQISFGITDATGQLTYSSQDIGATNYNGIMKFKASTLSAI